MVGSHWFVILVLLSVTSSFAKKRDVTLPTSPEVVELTKSNWDNYVNGARDVFVEFYVPWCHHCEKLAPILGQVARHYLTKPLGVVGRVNAEKELPLSVKYKVTGYPTLLLIGREKEEIYRGKRDNSQNFISWLDRRNFGVNIVRGEPVKVQDTHIPPPNLKEETQKLLSDPELRAKQSEVLSPKETKEAVPSTTTPNPSTTTTSTPPTSTSTTPEPTLKVESVTVKPQEISEDILLEIEQVFVDEVQTDNEPVISDSEDLSNTIDGFFYGKDDVPLFWQAWIKNPSKKQTSVVILHGLGDHSNRYKNLANQLNVKGYSVYSFDFRGHGRSEGTRGHLNEWEELREDFSKFLQLVFQKENPNHELQRNKETKKIVLVGHSLGGIVGLEYLLHPLYHKNHKDLVNGLILVSPLFENNATSEHGSEVGISGLGDFVDNAMSSLLPTFTVDQSDSHLTKLTGDAKKLREIKLDPLFHFEASYRLLSEIKVGQENVRNNLSRLPTSILIQHGKSDQISPISGSQKLYDDIIFPEVWSFEKNKKVKQRYSKSLKVYPKSHHRILDDLDSTQVVSDLVSWLESVPLENERS